MARELIDRYALIKDMYEDGYFPLTVADKATEKVMAQPTVDAVEVVRCKDCKHKDFYKQRVYCYKIDRYRQVNDFCSCGAKMDGGDKA